QLFASPKADDQPTARPVSKINGRYLDVEAGPNWDDDLSGSSIYARNDINLRELPEAQREALFRLQQMVFFYIPRICNHCLNPSCVAVCPSGAAYKRAEDGIVLINQDKCRGWRFCVSGCPYKKSYYNWKAGKSEKCLLCYPRVETGQAPACFHSCVGRIRYIGVLLYDAARIPATAKMPEADLVQAQRDLILDPFDKEVIAGARANGVSDDWIAAAQKSPCYKFVKKWGLALPLHAEFRTLPMLYYVPPLLPVLASTENGSYDLAGSGFFGTIDDFRVPLKYMARLFAGGNVDIIKKALNKLWAVRAYKQAQSAGNITAAQAKTIMTEAGCTGEEAEEIFRLTALPRFEDRFILPPYHRETTTSLTGETIKLKGQTGFGTTRTPGRGP
ncbi:MAG: 4Fe-4S dicluster domain-containing protein, partial [Chloroflexi bacterium]|nr:4Fe-4S dicluster domain-containing protein [Chloroflexota bacterium]